MPLHPISTILKVGVAISNEIEQKFSEAVDQVRKSLNATHLLWVRSMNDTTGNRNFSLMNAILVLQRMAQVVPKTLSS